MSKRRPGLEYRHGSPADGAVPGRVSDPAGARVAGAGLALPLAGLLLCLPVLGLVLGLGACAAEPSGGRVLVLGLDGMDPGTIDLLISEGKLPNFERLRKEGAYAPLESRVPLMSPVIWTTVATGMTPDVHGIGAFVAVNEKTGDRMPVTSQMRQVKALWTLATEAGLSSAVVGWWATWPAETVRGSIVSDHLCYHFLFERALEEDSSSLGLTHPEALQEELQSQVIRPDDISYEEARRFVDVSPDEFDRPFDYYDDLSHFRWALATARTHAGIGLDLWRRERPELAMVYIEGTDSTSHLFGHLFRADGLQGDLAEQHRRYGRTVEEMYGFADDLVGEYMAAMDEETTLVILSDHGFRLGELLSDPTKIEDLRRVRTNQHSLHGILYMAGRHVLPGTGLDDPSIMDIAPTLLALLGLPASEEMSGRVLTEALTLDPPARVPSHETGEPGGSRLARDSRVDPQILARLESLGYLDTTAPRSDRVLAGAMFSEGKLEEALARYRKLLLEQPDSPGLHVSVAGTLGQLGRYDEADEHLARALSINPLSSPAYHNRGVIAERRGNTAQAIRDYRTALRYKPDYDPSREALIRLVGTAEPPRSETEAGREADRLASQAAEAAKRGAFETAMSLLDEAQEIAPEHAILYQYRSNVAYLMGDREAAIRALESGLELEPDNALFSENLRTLREKARETPEP